MSVHFLKRLRRGGETTEEKRLLDEDGIVSTSNSEVVLFISSLNWAGPTRNDRWAQEIENDLIVFGLWYVNIKEAFYIQNFPFFEYEGCSEAREPLVNSLFFHLFKFNFNYLIKIYKKIHFHLFF